jgi:hypothetical protein
MTGIDQHHTDILQRHSGFSVRKNGREAYRSTAQTIQRTPCIARYMRGGFPDRISGFL